MADVKKNALTTIGAPKKEKKVKSAPKTVRFLLTLGESNEKTCPEFNYKELLAGEDRRSQKKSSAPVPHQNGGTSLMDVDEEDEAGMRAIALKFEQKYGSGGGGSPSGSKPKSGSKRKKNGNEEYVDLGAGYDDNDSFIDNTDAYDEIVPEEMTTAQGGFYINCGALEYKQLEVAEQPSDNEETVRSRKRVKRAIVSSEESSSDEDDDDIDEEEDSHDEVELQPKTPKPQDPQPKSEVPKPQVPPAAKPQLGVSTSLPLPQATEAKKLKRPAETASPGPSKKKSTTVKDLLKEKRDTNDPLPKEPPPAPNVAVGPPKVSASSTSISDSIESVINAAWLMDDAPYLPRVAPAVPKVPPAEVTVITPVVVPPAPPVVAPVVTPTVAASKPEPSPVTSSPNAAFRLPEQLSEEVRLLAQMLRATAKESGGNHAKFFSAITNKALIRLELKTQNLACRQQVFAFVAERVVCSAESLMKKARKLVVAKERAIKAKEPFNKLKVAIDQLSPAVLERYAGECQKYSDARFAAGQLGEPWSKSPPSQIFPWSLELRSLLGEVVTQQRARSSDDKTLRAFLEEQVRPLWPSGWMSTSTLVKEAQVLLRPQHNEKVAAPSPPPQRSTSVITLAESPRLPDSPAIPRPVQHVPLSLKQRILQDAVGGAFEPAVLAKQEERLSERPSPPPHAPRPGSSNSGKHSPSPSSSRDKPAKAPSKLSKPIKDRSEKKSNSNKSTVKSDLVKVNNKPETTKTSKSSNLKKKWTDIDIVDIPKEIIKPVPTQEEIEAKLLEHKNKLIEETDAATDFLSQIIHQSLSDFPNASNFATTIETKNHTPPAKIETLVRQEKLHRTESVPEVPIQREEVRERKFSLGESGSRDRKHSSGESSSTAARTSGKGRQTPESREPPALDPEVSVQLEMKRVMQELMELNGQMNAVSEPPKLSPVLERVKSKSDQRESPLDVPIISPHHSLSITPIERPRSRVDKARARPGTPQPHTNSSPLSNNSEILSPINYSSPSSAGSTPSHALNNSGRNSGGVSVIAVNSLRPNVVTNPVLGFQEEFQRHLMQEPEVVFVSSSPPSAFRPNSGGHQQVAAAVGGLAHPLYPSHAQQRQPTAEELRASLYNYPQLQGSLQQMLGQQRGRHFPPELPPK